MIIKEIMTANPESIEANATIAEAAEKLYEGDIRHLPVLRENELIGMLSDRDLKGYVWSFRNEIEDPENAEQFPKKAVSELMSGTVLSVNPEQEVQVAIDILLDNKVGAVAVVDPHESSLVGILSYVDILKACRDSL